MTRAVAGKRKIESRTKVKTGCTTCRIRKIKCDEGKPSCQRCLKTGRTCDGYDSPFRNLSSQSVKNFNTICIESEVTLEHNGFLSTEVTVQDVELLNQYFSTKTLVDVNLGCDKEAREVLQASLTDPSIRHAVSCLRILGEDLQLSRKGLPVISQETERYNYATEQYSMALGGLASGLSSPSLESLKSALLCCQVFISIEQARGSFALMARHIIGGLRITREYQTRPILIAPNRLLPASHDSLPSLDVFIIKMFAAPCRFTDPSVIEAANKMKLSSSSSSSTQQPLRAIALDLQTGLTKIAQRMLELLSKMSQVKSTEKALPLQSDKTALLDSLDSWLIDLRHSQIQSGRPDFETISESFMRLFHSAMRIVLLGTVDSSSNSEAELQVETERFQSLADSIDERLKAYSVGGGNGSDQESQLQIQ